MLSLRAEPRVAARLLAQIVLRRLGGKGSGNFGHEGRPGEKGGSGEGGGPSAKPGQDKVRNERSLRALKAFIPIHAGSQRYAEKNELLVRKMVGGVRTDDNKPVDVIVSLAGRVHGIEVKTMVNNTNDKITMRKAAIEKKDFWGRSNHASVHTVVLDDRGRLGNKGYSGHRVYYAKGSGSFRIGSMTKVNDAEHLKSLIAGKLRKLGGKGSGNFGHGGRPGQVGGSSDEGGLEAQPAPISKEQAQKIHELKAQGMGNAAIAKRMGWHYSEGKRVQRVIDTHHPTGERKEGVAPPRPVREPVPEPVRDPEPERKSTGDYSPHELMKYDVDKMISSLKEDRVRVRLPYPYNSETPKGRENLQIVHNGLTQMVAARQEMREAGVKPPAMRLQFVPNNNTPSAYASASWSGRVVKVNTKNTEVWTSQERLNNAWASDYRTGFHPTSTPHSILVHEMGHQLHVKEIGREKFTSTEHRENFDNRYSREVSRYATYNRLEFVAETFTGLVSGKTYSQGVMDEYHSSGGPKVRGRKTS